MPALLRVLAPLLCATCLLGAAAAAKRVRVCGRDLADTLAFVCRDRGGFNDLPSFYLGGASRAGSGVADDCCRLGCSLHTMQRYCKYDDVIAPPKPRDDEDEHFSLLLHGRGAQCDDWRPAWRVPPHGDVECACSSSCPESNDLPLEDIVRQARKPPPPLRNLDAVTRRPFVAGRVEPYFAGRPVAVAFLEPPT